MVGFIHTRTSIDVDQFVYVYTCVHWRFLTICMCLNWILFQGGIELVSFCVCIYIYMFVLDSHSLMRCNSNIQVKVRPLIWDKVYFIHMLVTRFWYTHFYHHLYIPHSPPWFTLISYYSLEIMHTCYNYLV